MRGVDGARIEIVCSSRELFGADRSALRLAEVLRTLGATPVLVVPSARPERGLGRAAEVQGFAYHERDVAVVSGHGIQGASGLVRARRGQTADLVIVNSAAVVSVPGPSARKLLMLREWLTPASIRHRVLVARHRFDTDAVVAVSTDVLRQWRACSRGPSRQYVVPNWLTDSVMDEARRIRQSVESRGGILFLGRFNGWKGQNVLADAWELAFANMVHVPSLTFVGAQPGTEFAGAAASLVSRAERWGWRVLPFESSPEKYLRSAALLVVPSVRPEPFGAVLLEGLAYGCRVVTFPGGGPTDLATVFRRPLELVPRSTSALAAALAAWWRSGGTAQASDEYAETLRLLAKSYSAAAAVDRWKQLL